MKLLLVLIIYLLDFYSVTTDSKLVTPRFLFGHLVHFLL